MSKGELIDDRPVGGGEALPCAPATDVRLGGRADAAEPTRQQLASDNWAGICPEALDAFLLANGAGHQTAYGDDVWTQRVCDRIREMFNTDCQVFFVFNGTAANSLALASLCRSYHSVICHPVAHIETDECGGPEFFSNGSKILLAEGANGKLTPDGITALVTKRSDIHFPKPKVVSLTQSTEVGTVYSVAELQAIQATAATHNLKIHMDGARFANAVATLGVHPAEITWRAGVDVLCFGGTKNGLPVGDAVVFFDHHLAEDFAYRVKQAGQLASKMRFISAPWLGLLDNDVWVRNAAHANAMALRLHNAIAHLPHVRVLFTPEANAVFVALPDPVRADLAAKGWRFYTFIGAGGCRLMCSWDTTPKTVDRFAADLTASVARVAAP